MRPRFGPASLCAPRIQRLDQAAGRIRWAWLAAKVATTPSPGTPSDLARALRSPIGWKSRAKPVTFQPAPSRGGKRRRRPDDCNYSGSPPKSVVLQSGSCARQLPAHVAGRRRAGQGTGQQAIRSALHARRYVARLQGGKRRAVALDQQAPAHAQRLDRGRRRRAARHKRASALVTTASPNTIVRLGDAAGLDRRCLAGLPLLVGRRRRLVWNGDDARRVGLLRDGLGWQRPWQPSARPSRRPSARPFRPSSAQRLLRFDCHDVGWRGGGRHSARKGRDPLLEGGNARLQASLLIAPLLDAALQIADVPLQGVDRLTHRADLAPTPWRRH